MRKTKYDFQSFEVGQSREYNADRNQLAAACSGYAKKNGAKFSVKKGDNSTLIVTRVS